MYLVLWEFDVKLGCEKQFESVYGRFGDWAKLFSRNPLYYQTLLLRDPSRPRTYATLDFWASHEAYAAFQKANLKEYLALDRQCEAMISAERKIGSYGQLPDNL
jgi:heme-degrading monooxygenase HmoA